MVLNPQQREAVRHGGHLALESCPGSGKTRTIVSKVLRCIDDVRGSTRRVAAITYTNAAVDEMQARVQTYGSTDDHQYYEIATIHSFCVSTILRPYHYLLPTFADGFTLIGPDEERWQELVTELIATHDLPTRPQTQEAFDRIHRQLDGTVFCPADITEAAAREFLGRLDEGRLVSFAEIMFHTATLLKGFAFIARAMASRYAWLLVDEFQDTSAEQVEIFRAIAARGQTRFFLVGDLNQAIMSFAGAQPALMGEFADMIGARRDIRLYGNYRCSSRVVAHAERLCRGVTPMEALGDSRDDEVEPTYHHVASPAEGIREVFLPALAARSIELGAAAVLAPWWIPLYKLGRSLREHGIRVIGPGARPYKRTHAFASLAENLAAHSRNGGAQSFRRLQRALLFTLRDVTGDLDWRVFSYGGRVALCDLLGQLRAVPEDCSGWLTSAADISAELLVRAEMMSPTRAEALRASAAGMLVEMKGHDIDPESTTIDAIGMFAQPEEALHLITMHKAKGREFDAIAIVDLHDGRVPDYRIEDTDVEAIAEARRLLYVAVTRARKVLMYFTDASDWRNRPSRFLGRDGLNVM